MPDITAALVKELREKTDAPMMECKKALTEAHGDLGKAEEILRVRLGNKASKAAARLTAEGVVALHVDEDGRTGAMVELNSETDFVAKNEDFVAFSRELAQLVAAHDPPNLEALGRCVTGQGASVEDARTALVGRIGENISIRRFARMRSEGRIASYLHGGSRIGVLVDVTGGNDALGRDLAMHIAASKPKALHASEVSEELIASERRVAEEKAKEAGKPAEMIAKIVEGTVQKFLKEVTLLGQPFVKDDKQTIDQLCKSNKAEVASFTLYIVGEGIEKKVTDFAAEVAAQAAAAAR